MLFRGLRAFAVAATSGLPAAVSAARLDSIRDKIVRQEIDN